MIIVAGKLTIDPAKAEDAKEAAAAVMTATRAEAGNNAYVIAIDPIEEGVLNIFEQWADEDALTSHMGEPHMAAFMAAMGTFGIADMSVKKYTGAQESDLF